MPDLDIRLNIRNKPPGQGQWPPVAFTLCQNNSDYAYQYTGGNYDNSRGFAYVVETLPVTKIIDVRVIGACDPARGRRARPARRRRPCQSGVPSRPKAIGGGRDADRP